MLAPPEKPKPETLDKPLHRIAEQLREKLAAVGIVKRPEDMTSREAEDAQDLLLAKWLSVPRQVVLKVVKTVAKTVWRKWPQ